MKVSSLAPWYGSKRTLAPEIVRQLGPHRAYWEPFCGSMAVLLAKPISTFESVNDLHKDLINLAVCVQDPKLSLELYERAYRCILHEDMTRIALTFLLGREVEIPDVERAYWYLVFSWMAINGVAGTPLYNGHSIAARFSAKGGHGATRWRSVVESIPDWHARLFPVQILARDGFEIIDAIDDAPGTVLYVDPPYLEKGSRYVHDFEPNDHCRLAEALKRFRHARVVLSYYEHPDLAGLYPGWAKVGCAIAKAMVQGAKRDKTGRAEAPEVLLINGPPIGGDQATMF